MSSKTKKIILILVLGLTALGALVFYQSYKAIYRANVQEDFVIWLYEDQGFEDIYADYAPYFAAPEDFKRVAVWKNLEDKLKIGRYEIKAGMSANAVVNLLLAGRQSPKPVVINLVKDLKDLSELLGRELHPSDSAFLQYFQSSEFLDKYQLANSEALGFFIPNTYEFYWTTSPKAFAERMAKENERFWQKRKEALKGSGLSKSEVISLASIVESETARFDEMPKVAGLYLNRLQEGIKLQSDPTVIYAWQQEHPQDVIKRVLYKHLEIESPYNTYKNVGLPPGPIRIVSPQAIDAVLKAEDHQYIFMCADPARPGYHAFTRSLREHNINRQRYTSWLREQQRIARETKS